MSKLHARASTPASRIGGEGASASPPSFSRGPVTGCDTQFPSAPCDRMIFYVAHSLGIDSDMLVVTATGAITRYRFIVKVVYSERSERRLETNCGTHPSKSGKKLEKIVRSLACHSKETQ